MALGVEGVRVGCWTANSGISGVTVILPPDGTVGGIAVRGAAPGTREAAALGPAGKVEICNAIVLSGGSAFGLATADGVMDWLEERGSGYPVRDAVVPIVGAAIVLDGGVFDRASRPGAAAGRAACDAATDGDPPEGAVGVGAGCTIAKVAGIEHAWRGGQGIAIRQAAGVTVGVVVANNAVGELIGDDGRYLARARVPDDAPRYPTHGGTLRGGPPGQHAEQGPEVDAPRPDGPAPEVDAPRPDGPAPTRPAAAGPTANTVIGCVVTNARLTKLEACRVADLAHSGIARAIRPAHTEADGDALFCLATGQVTATADLVAHLAADAVAEAARRGPLASAGADGIPGLADTPR